jgi:hypothetical protein
MKLIGMLDMNVRVPLRLQIVHKAILFALQIDEHKYRNRGAVNETLNIHGTRLTLRRSSVNPSGTIRARADYFFPIGSVIMRQNNVTQAPPCTGVPFGKRAR